MSIEYRAGDRIDITIQGATVAEVDGCDIYADTLHDRIRIQLDDSAVTITRHARTNTGALLAELRAENESLRAIQRVLLDDMRALVRGPSASPTTQEG